MKKLGVEVLATMSVVACLMGNGSLAAQSVERPSGIGVLDISEAVPLHFEMPLNLSSQRPYLAENGRVYIVPTLYDAAAREVRRSIWVVEPDGSVDLLMRFDDELIHQDYRGRISPNDVIPLGDSGKVGVMTGITAGSGGRGPLFIMGKGFVRQLVRVGDSMSINYSGSPNLKTTVVVKNLVNPQSLGNGDLAVRIDFDYSANRLSAPTYESVWRWSASKDSFSMVAGGVFSQHVKTGTTPPGISDGWFIDISHTWGGENGNIYFTGDTVRSGDLTELTALWQMGDSGNRRLVGEDDALSGELAGRDLNYFSQMRSGSGGHTLISASGSDEDGELFRELLWGDPAPKYVLVSEREPFHPDETLPRAVVSGVPLLNHNASTGIRINSRGDVVWAAGLSLTDGTRLPPVGDSVLLWRSVDDRQWRTLWAEGEEIILEGRRGVVSGFYGLSLTDEGDILVLVPIVPGESGDLALETVWKLNGFTGERQLLMADGEPADVVGRPGEVIAGISLAGGHGLSRLGTSLDRTGRAVFRVSTAPAVGEGFGVQRTIEVLPHYGGYVFIDVGVNDDAQGAVDPIGYVRHGSEVTVNAASAGASSFVDWQVNGEVLSGDANYTFVAESDLSLVAAFGMAASGYDKWITEIAGEDEALRDPLADADQNGLANLVDYATGEGEGRVSYRASMIEDGEAFALDLNLRTDDPKLSFLVEFSNDLAQWERRQLSLEGSGWGIEGSEFSQPEILSVDDEFARLRVGWIDQDQSPGERTFFRLAIELE